MQLLPLFIKIVQSIAGIVLFSLVFFLVNPVKLQLQLPDCLRILFSYANYGYYCT